MAGQEEILIAGRYTPTESMKAKPKEEKKEQSKKDKKDELKVKVEKELKKKLTSGEAVKIRDSILEEKRREEEASLFQLIQNKIKEVLNNFDQESEVQQEILKGLKDARQVLISAAKQIGALDGIKSALLEAQMTDDYEKAKERVSRINTGSLEHQATSLLEGRSPDFGGMNQEYRAVAGYVMELALLEAKGEEKSSEADNLRRKIEYLGWGTPPPKIYDQAIDYVEKSAKKTKKEGEERDLDVKTPTAEDEKDRYEQEKKYIEGVLERYIKEAVELVGDNNNIEPFKTRSLDSAIYMMQDFETHLEEDLMAPLAKGESLPEKARLILERVKKLREWTEGTSTLLRAAGMVLEDFYDGMGQLENTVKKRGRVDIRMTDLKKVFADLQEAKLRVDGEWQFGDEILRKQDEVLMIFRAIGAAHRVKGRNSGRNITAQHKTLEDEKVREKVVDYKINQKQLTFIEKVFDSKERVFKQQQKKETEDWLLTIEDIFDANDIIYKDDQDGKKNTTLKSYETAFKTQKERKLIFGKEYELKGNVLRQIKKELRKNKAVWVDGVKWEVEEGREKDSIKDIISELDWRIGSGDKVFIGQEYLVQKDNYVDFVLDNFRKGDKAALLKETPYEIDNPFVVYSTPQSVEKIMAKISWMIDKKVTIMDKDGKKREISLWGALKDEDAEVDIEEAVKDCAKTINAGEVKPDLINDHIINMSRIFILYTAESAEVGWGFDFKKEQIGGTDSELTNAEIKKWEKDLENEDKKKFDNLKLILGGKEEKISNKSIEQAKSLMDRGYSVIRRRKTGVVLRSVSTGGTKAATDISTPLHWLRTEAGNKWKDWTRGMLPLSKRTSRWIDHHEPGWVPGLDKNGNWRVSYLGKELYIHKVPAKLELGLLNIAKIKEGKHEGKRILDLAYNEVAMSEVPYSEIDDDILYRRGYIDWSQAALLLALISKPLDRDTMARFLGLPRESVPRTMEYDELMKRVTLATRNLAEDEGAQEFIPLLVSLGLAFQENLLKSSAEPGVFYPSRVKRMARNTETSLLEFAPQGDTQVGVEIGRRFTGYMDTLTNMGRALNVHLNRARHLRRSLEDIDEEIEIKKRKNQTYLIS
jgi:hypothetical protein